MKQFLILLFIACTVGCRSSNSGEYQTIHIQKNIVDAISIDDILTEYRFVSLEATGSSIVGDPQKVILKNDVIFVFDGRRIFQFTTQGDFLRTLDRRGRGPQEYLGIWDFTVSTEEIIIWDQNSKTIFRYSLDNTYINSYPIDHFAATIYLIDKDSLLFSSNYQRFDDYKFIIRDLKTMDSITSFYPINKAQRTYRHFMGQMNYYVYKNTLLFHEPMNNYIYKIENGEFKPVYYFDIYGHSTPDAFWDQEYEHTGAARMTAQEKGYCYGTPTYVESDAQVFFSFFNGDKNMYCRYLKKTGESVQFERLTLFQDLPAVKPWTYSDSEDHILLIFDSSDFFDENNMPYVTELSHISNNGNPVICIAKLK